MWYGVSLKFFLYGWTCWGAGGCSISQPTCSTSRTGTKFLEPFTVLELLYHSSDNITFGSLRMIPIMMEHVSCWDWPLLSRGLSVFGVEKKSAWTQIKTHTAEMLHPECIYSCNNNNNSNNATVSSSDLTESIAENHQLEKYLFLHTATGWRWWLL